MNGTAAIQNASSVEWAADTASLEAIRAKIARIWGEHACGIAALKVLDLFVADPGLREVGYGPLSEMAGIRVEDVVSSGAVLVQGVDCLAPALLFQEGDRAWRLPISTIDESEKRGWMPHPETGERIVDWKSVVYPVLDPTPLLLDRIKEDKLHGTVERGETHAVFPSA